MRKHKLGERTGSLVEKNRIKIEEIINLIQNEDIKILDISTDDADLEDVFLRLIKN